MQSEALMFRQKLNQSLVAKGLPTLSGNIYCIGRNFAAHATELGNEVPDEPVIFLKSPAALRDFSKGPLAFSDESFHHEIELVLLLNPDANWQSKTGWTQAVAAMTLGLDLTRRGVQKDLKAKGLPWARAKSFAGAALLGPFVTKQEDWQNQRIDLSLRVNGELRQQGDTSQLLFDFRRVLDELQRLAPIEPGDLVFTGTPPGVASLGKGDQILAVSERLGLRIDGEL